MANDNSNRMKCPKCGEEFAVEEVLRSHVEQEVREELAAAMQLELQSKLEALKAEQADKTSAQMEKIEELREEKRRLTKIESDYKDLELENEALQDKGDENIKRAKKEQELKTRRELRDQFETEQAEFEKAQAEEREEEREKVKEKLKKKEEELKLQSRLELEQKIAEQLSEKDQELEKARLETKRLREEMQRIEKGQSGGHSELIGESFEQAVEHSLREHFPHDTITEIKKGARGADLIQSVCTRSRLPRGKIVWECKNQKSWKHDWIPKIRKDALEEGADAKVIVTTVMPRELENQVYGEMDDVFVCQYSVVPVVGALLRDAILKLAKERMVQGSLPTIQGQLLDYIRGDEFKNVLRMVISAYREFDDDLRKEEEYMKSKWKARRKYLARVLDGMTSMAGTITAIGGGELDLNQELFEKPIAALAMEAEE